MKKALLISMTIFTITTAYSQIGKGNKFIGGRINLYGNNDSHSDTVSNYNSRNFSTYIIPNIGFFIKDNFAVGANLQLGIINNSSYTEYSNQIPSKTGNKYNSISYGIGGFARYYKKITDNFLLFVNGGVSYAYQTKKIVSTNSIFPNNEPFEAIQQSVSVAVSPGLVYFITPKLGIESSFGNLNYTYSSSKNKKPINENVNSSQYGINLNYLAFGLSYYF